MKILFTGGGTGGHYYPIIAVAEEIHRIVLERNLVRPTLYYMASHPYDERLLFEHDIIFKHTPSGKMRNYRSFLNFLDMFKTAFGIARGILQVFSIFPDVVFSKGGYDSVPAVFAARLFRIPVVIHDSDAMPGRANIWASKFAKRIAISYPEAAQYFGDKANIAYTGNPIRSGVSIPVRFGTREFFSLEEALPTILILGGSQGAERINDAVLGILPELVGRYQIIHQTGHRNFKEMHTTAQVILERSNHKNRYRPYAYLNELELRMAGGAADIIISRAGSGSIFEIAAWEKPSILIPIPEAISHDQRKNAFAYARVGAAMVIEEKNLTPHLLMAEIDRLVGNPALRQEMANSAMKFKRPEAAKIIAESLIEIALSHER